MNNPENVRTLIQSVLHDLAEEAEALLLIAAALEDQATDVSSNTHPQRLREIAALVKSGALQMGLAAAKVVGAAERLDIVALLSEFEDSGAGGLAS